MLNISALLNLVPSSVIQAFEVPIDSDEERSKRARLVVSFAVRHYQLLSKWKRSLKDLAKLCYSLTCKQIKLEDCCNHRICEIEL